ncbi:SDR family NAD(P)-dependent oxidoreductase [Chitinophaga silvisoli]|uniref:SDR family NAD(P)-dependent oxidoreductase n=1 Tax=Chitinophaga silvisoli TaxID=2291814 RepID=A0A3E1NU51_9BACT|nr:SDR family NAD(P)-dependent oxidoreductase [Chitinophaga silvisoli]RFM31469.1 SDR family NAD(P)-dependent oxidoreductase [Chitinophaga silvisoli]
MKKVALVTGGSSGLGLELARRLGNLGYIIYLLARNQERLSLAVNELRTEGIEADGFPIDVLDERGLLSVREELCTLYSKIDYLVLNAGIVKSKLFSSYEESADLRQQLDVNLWGTILPTYVMLPLLKPGAKVLMVSSGGGLTGIAGYAAYCASKAGIVNFGEALRRELLCKKISVYVACPGDFDSPMAQEAEKEAPRWMKKQSSAKLMKAVDVAGKILTKAVGSRFLILPAGEVKMLMLLKRLPGTLSDKILDAILPRPAASDT